MPNINLKVMSAMLGIVCAIVSISVYELLCYLIAHISISWG